MVKGITHPGIEIAVRRDADVLLQPKNFWQQNQFFLQSQTQIVG
jgi:hypothetical protein